MPSSMPMGVSVPKTGRLGTLFKVPIDYILETSQGDMITLPNKPTMYMQSRPSASLITYTLNSYVKENTRYRNTTIELRGASGYMERAGYNRKGDVIFQNGLIILEEFDHWLNEWQKTAANRDYLVFRSLNEGFAYKVSVEKFEWSRDADQSKFSYQWSLSLHAYDEAPESKLTPIFSPVTETVKAITDQIDVASASIAILDNTIQNTNKEVSQIIRGPVQAVNRIALALRQVANSLDGILLQLPSSVLSDIFKVIGNTVEAVRTVKGTVQGVLGIDETFDPYKDQIDELLSESQAMQNSVVELAGVTGALIGSSANTEAQIELKRVDNQVSLLYTIRPGESIRTIAQRQLNNEGALGIILTLNNLRDQYTYANGRPVLPGDEILLPVLEIGNGGTFKFRQDDYFYTDFLLGDDGDLKIKGNDLVLVNQENNLVQAIKNRVLTEKGSARTMLDYGLPVLIGGSVTNRTSAFLTMHIKEQLLKDPRISSVAQVQILVQGDQVAIECKVTSVQGVSIPLIVPIKREIN